MTEQQIAVDTVQSDGGCNGRALVEGSDEDMVPKMWWMKSLDTPILLQTWFADEEDEKIPETCTKGKKTTVPIQQEDPYMTGITYFFTSNSPKMKPFSIENVMLVNMLSMATGTRVACDFVILTRKDLSQAIHFLRSLGHSVTTAMASSFDQSLHLMRDASNNTIIWPNWEAGASSSSQMEVDEDSAARKRVYRGHH
ncbi:hypothetical protein Tco_0233703 [Tanacetum coccineum]